MKIKTFELEFRYFDGACWEYLDKEIIAISKIQLIRCFIYETCVIHYETRRQCWDRCKKWITEDTLEFPIVNTK